MKTFISRLFAAVTMLVLAHGSALACAACENPAGSARMNNAATIGIFAMVAIMFVMLGALIGCGFYFNYRAKHPMPDYSELINDGPAQPQPGTSP